MAPAAAPQGAEHRAALLFVAAVLIARLVAQVMRASGVSPAELHTLYTLALLTLAACALTSVHPPPAPRARI